MAHTPTPRWGEGGHSHKNWVGVYSPPPKTFTLFMTRPRPDQKFDTLTIGAGTVALNIIYNGLMLIVLSTTTKKYLLPKKHIKFKARVQKPYPITWLKWPNLIPYLDYLWPKQLKTIPFKASDPHIAHIRQYPLPTSPVPCQAMISFSCTLTFSSARSFIQHVPKHMSCHPFCFILIW